MCKIFVNKKCDNFYQNGVINKKNVYLDNKDKFLTIVNILKKKIKK